ncbi:motile sperm domain-containing protein 2 isoform X2 [Halyomorpha halys]|nr:motile sperm domain-containing protein 2 isoform X2 [Halyomorpha halys]
MKEALNMLLETCEWRKTNKVNEINENNINMNYLNDGSVFVHNRDKDGKSLFIFTYKKHVKGQKDFEELKKIVIYWMERVERADKGEPVTVFFDMQDTGLSNADMEFIKYIISLFKLYYPYSLNYILILDMPWVLNAAFKIIKTWLPAKAVQKIKNVDKKSLKDYVDSTQALKAWGGQDTYEFTFVPENIADGKNEENKKKVHFADGSQISEASHNAFGDSKLDESPSSTRLTLNPADAICFGQEGLDLAGTLTITNATESTLIYKVKTTSPEKFRVRPSCGLLSPSASATINVVLLTGFTGANILRDKFLVLSYPLENHDTHSNVDLNELWKINSDPKKLEEHRLRCKVPSIQPCAHNGSPGSLTTLAGAVSPTSELEQKITQLLISMTHLTECNAKMQNELVLLRRLIFIIIFLVMFCGVALLLFLPMPPEQGFCPATISKPSLKLEE